MSIADEIINRQLPHFDHYLQQGESLDDIDEYGFTPLIQCVITGQIKTAEALIARQVDVNKDDVSGRTALHWAVDNNDFDFAEFLLKNGADPNAYTRAGLSILVYPLLRNQETIVNLLYRYGAKIDFPLDFIGAKLIGHRYSLTGDVDVVNAALEFIEVDYEGFILEFSVAILNDSLHRFVSSYSTRQLRRYFPPLYEIMDALTRASELLQLQHIVNFDREDLVRLETLIQHPLVILPAASRGHAMGFVRYKNYWAKIDRGENAHTEGSINIYEITRPSAFSVNFIRHFLYKKQKRQFFHRSINKELGLKLLFQIPMAPQSTGNCSWANMQAIIPAAYHLLQEEKHLASNIEEALALYETWIEWDQDRALDECLGRFYLASPLRKASLASMLAAVLYHTCDYADTHDIGRSEKILSILTLPDYYYILKTYLEEYCVKRLTRRGNNLLKLLEDFGFNPNIGVNAIATGLREGD